MSIFLGATHDEAAKVCIIGLPYDGTTTYRPGARFGPEAIRSASYGLESYDPRLELDLEEYNVCDFGDVELPPGTPRRALELAKQECKRLCTNRRFLALGGEHLLSLPLVELALEEYGDDLLILQIDAHADLRTEYLGEPLSHACVMRRITELVGFDRVKQIGIRSGTREEWQLMRKHNTLIDATPEALRKFIASIGSRPIYLSLDLDVLDPSVLPGTGAPEPGGLCFRELEDLLFALRGANLVAADIMELAPTLDQSGASAVAAAKLARTLLLMLAELES